MSIILSIESSSKNTSIAINRNNKLLCLCEEASHEYKQSEKLHQFINWVLEGAEITINQLEIIAVGIGPGSYTGLRIGVAAAKGLSFGLEIPVVSINSLENLMIPYIKNKYDYIIPVIDARRMEIYTASFNALGNRIEPDHSHILNNDSFKEFKNKKILFIGDAVEKTKYFLENIDYPVHNYMFKFSYPSAKNMSSLAIKKIGNKQFENINLLEPHYLKEWKS